MPRALLSGSYGTTACTVGGRNASTDGAGDTVPGSASEHRFSGQFFSSGFLNPDAGEVAGATPAAVDPSQNPFIKMLRTMCKPLPDKAIAGLHSGTPGPPILNRGVLPRREGGTGKAVRFAPGTHSPTPGTLRSIKDQPPKEVPSALDDPCLLYTSPSPRDRTRSRMPSSA